MHILQLCPRVPYPPHDGGAIAMYETARGLAEAGHRVTVLAINTPKHHQPADVLDHLGPSVHLVTVDVDTELSPVKALKNLLFGELPYNIERFISPQLTKALLGLLRQGDVDVVQFEGSFVAWYNTWEYDELIGEIPTVLRAHNIEYTIWEMLAHREANLLKRWYLRQLARRLKRFEQHYLTHFNAVAAITPEDADRLRALGCPEPVATVPASFDLRRLRPDPAAQPRPRSVFVIGSLNWLPNLEGLDWFLQEVWPQAHAEMPELELHVAGLRPPAHLTSRPPGQDNVFIHGFVESAAAFMQQYELMLVPLLSGGGMRVKIVEGLALGKAILSTHLGAEGVAVQDGRDIVVRDGAAGWLAALRDYYHGGLPVAVIGAAAARTAAEVYDSRQVTRQFERLYAQVLGDKG